MTIKKITILSLIFLLININLTQTMGFWDAISSNKNVKKYLIGTGTLAAAGFVGWKLWKLYNSQNIVTNIQNEQNNNLNKNFDDDEKNNAEADGNITEETDVVNAVDASIKTDLQEQKTREEFQRETQAALETSKQASIQDAVKTFVLLERYIQQRNDENDRILNDLALQEKQKEEAYKQKIANKVAEIKQKWTNKKQELIQEKEDKELLEKHSLLLQTLEEEIIPIISNSNYSNYQKLVDNYLTWMHRLNKLRNSFDSNSENDNISLSKLERLLKNLQSAYNKGPWIDGQIILRKIYNDESIQGDYLKNIAQLFWHLYSLCVAKNQSFERGVIKLEDENNKIFNFLNAYNKTKKRTSSHFKEYQNQAFGIDIPHDLRENLCFQSNKFHLLFQQLEPEIIVIKPEDHGTDNPTDLAWHAIGFLQSTYRKLVDPSANEQKHIRCEYPAIAILNKWDALLSEFELSNNETYIKAKTHGIHKMLELLKEDIFKANLNDQQRKVIEDFLETLKQYDNLQIRKGNEVILSVAELKGQKASLDEEELMQSL